MVDAKRVKSSSKYGGARQRSERAVRGSSSGGQRALERLIPSSNKPTESFLATQTRAAELLSEELTRAFRELAQRGVELTALGEPDQVVASIIERLPLARSRMAEAVGPCYTSGGLQAVLGMSRAALSKAVIERRALRLETSDGRNVYPAFQVHNGALVPGLRKVLLTLGGAIDDPWTWAMWLNATASQDPASKRRIDQLANGDVAGVLRAAMQTAAAWAA